MVSGLSFPVDVESSWTRDQTSVPCIGRRFLSTVPPAEVKSQSFSSCTRLRGGSGGKASAYNEGDLGSNPASGRSPGGGNGNPLQYSYLENPMGGIAWWATVHEVAKSQTRLSDFTFSPDLLDMDTYESRTLWLSWIIDPQGKVLSMKQVKTKGKIWHLVLVVMLLQTLPSTHSYIIIILI